MKKFQFSEIEKQHLFKAWMAISFAFAIMISGGLKPGFAYNLIMSAITVGAGFLLHEIAHKFAAIHFGCRAEFRADNQMLVLAIIMSFFGFLFAAPGAVIIQGTVTKKRNGIISLAGPAANIILAIIFLIALFLVPQFSQIAKYGIMINSFLAAFNLIPFGNIDGSKILAWDKKAYFITLGISIILLAISLYR